MARKGKEISKLMASRLSYLRMIHQITLSEIAKKLKISPSQVRFYARAMSPIPDEKISALAKFFGVGKDFFTDTRDIMIDIKFPENEDIVLRYSFK